MVWLSASIQVVAAIRVSTLHDTQGFCMQPISRTAVAGAALAMMAFGAQAVALVAINSQTELTVIDTNHVGAATNISITGLAAGEGLVGIDTHPSNGLIYGVSTANKIYTLNQVTGAASFVVNLGTAVINPNFDYGIDFNPLADFNSKSNSSIASLRLISSAGSNFGVNVATGTVGDQASNIGNGYSGASYTNSQLIPAAAPGTPTLYYINSSTDMLAMSTTSAFNAPTIVDVGRPGAGLADGLDVLKANGFEILGNGQAFAALTVDGARLTTGIYSITLGTGAATLLGNYNGSLSGLTVSAVPEPETYALMLAGLVAVASLVRRRSR